MPEVFIGMKIDDTVYEVNNGDYNDGGYGQNYPRPDATHYMPLPPPPEEKLND